MRTLFSIAVLLLLGTGSAWAGDVQSTSLTTVQVFRNVAGSTLTSGTSVVLDLAAESDVTIGDFLGESSTIGTMVTTTSTADIAYFTGVLVDPSCADDQLCRFAVRGPVLARWCGSTDDTDTDGVVIGTCNGVAGQLGSGSGAGFVIDATDATAPGPSTGSADNSLAWVWLQPEPAK